MHVLFGYIFVVHVCNILGFSVRMVVAINVKYMIGVDMFVLMRSVNVVDFLVNTMFLYRIRVDFFLIFKLLVLLSV